jgi:hypothetical protein
MRYPSYTPLTLLAIAAVGALVGWLFGDVLAVSIYDYEPTREQALYCAAITTVAGAFGLLGLYSALVLRAR